MSEIRDETAKQIDPPGDSGMAEVIENVDADLVPLKEIEPAAAQVEEVDQYQRDSIHAEEAFARAVDAASHGEPERAVQEFLRAAKIAETAREWYVAAVALERVAQFLQTPKPPANLERAFRIYHRAIAAYQNCGYFEEARRLLYRIQFLKLVRARELKIALTRRFELFVFWLLMGFGYRPLRVVFTAIGIVLIYALLYWVLDGVVVSATHEQADFWATIYFSGTTFTTIGYGDYVPRPRIRMLVLTEGALGMLSMGFFVVILSNRLRY